MPSLEEPVFWICMTILVVLFAGDPDLMGSIIKHVSECK